MITDVIIRNANKKGKGLFALRDFKKGEFIFRGRRGTLVKREDFGKLTQEESRHLGEVDQDTFEIQRSPGRYLNHSCDPNAFSKGQSLYALKSIRRGDEITVDYRATGNFTNRWKCYCGTKDCKGWVVSNFFTLPEERQRFYVQYAPKFIKGEYKNKHEGK